MHAGVYGGGRDKLKRCVFRHFPEVAVEGAAWTESSRLFHKEEEEQEQNALCAWS